MILGIDTSTETMSVALFADGVVVGEYTTNLKKNHSTRLMPAIEQLMAECNVSPTALNKIAVSEGPGSYTGLRIGVTIAKTMAWDLAIPLVGVPSLKVLAANGRFFQGKIVPLIDARRENVYAGVYEQLDGELKLLVAERHIALYELIEQFAGKEEEVLFIGQITTPLRELIRGMLGQYARFAEGADKYARAGNLTFLAADLVGSQVHTFVPKYLKLAEAESKWLKAREEE